MLTQERSFSIAEAPISNPQGDPLDGTLEQKLQIDKPKNKKEEIPSLVQSSNYDLSAIDPHLLNLIAANDRELEEMSLRNKERFPEDAKAKTPLKRFDNRPRAGAKELIRRDYHRNHKKDPDGWEDRRPHLSEEAAWDDVKNDYLNDSKKEEFPHRDEESIDWINYLPEEDEEMIPPNSEEQELLIEEVKNESKLRDFSITGGRFSNRPTDSKHLHYKKKVS